MDTNNLKLIRIKIFTTDHRDVYINKILSGLSSYISIDVEFLMPECISMINMRYADLIIFDNVDKIDSVNLSLIKTMNQIDTFLYISDLHSEKEDELYRAGMDYILIRDYNIKYIPPIMANLINKILWRKLNLNIIYYKECAVHLVNRTITVKDDAIQLTEKEFFVFMVLYMNKGSFVTKNKIFKDVWGYLEEDNTRLCDQYINKLRIKIGPKNIISKRFEGYKLVE